MSTATFSTFTNVLLFHLKRVYNVFKILFERLLQNILLWLFIDLYRVSCSFCALQ